MIAHTRVNRDARVTRAAQALSDSGYETHLICLHNSREQDLPAGLDCVRLHEIRDLGEATSRLRRLVAGNSTSSVLSFCRHLFALPLVLVSTILSFRPFRQFHFLLKSCWIGCRQKPSVVHCHDLNVLPIGRIICLIVRSVLVYDSHEIFPEKVAAKRWQRAWEWLEGKIAVKCAAVIVTTELRGEIFTQHYPTAPSPVVVHNYPSTVAVEQRDIRTLADVPENAFVALYQGGIQAHRGLEQLISCAEFLDEIYLVIQGDGPLLPEIRRLAAQSQRSKWIRVLDGDVFSELRTYTASANVGLQVLQPSSLNHTTTLSNKLFEYIHAGLPVVASDFPQIRQVVTRYEVGLLVDSTEPMQIAGALNHLHGCPEEVARFSKRANLAAQVLCWEREASILTGVYKRLEA